MLEKLIFIILAVDLALLLSVIVHDLIVWVKKKRGERSKRRKMYEEALIEDIAKHLQVTKECAHGEWRVGSGTPDGSFYCSNCSNCQHTADSEVTPLDIGFYYCPTCGAKMDGGNNNA